MSDRVPPRKNLSMIYVKLFFTDFVSLDYTQQNTILHHLKICLESKMAANYLEWRPWGPTERTLWIRFV